MMITMFFVATTAITTGKADDLVIDEEVTVPSSLSSISFLRRNNVHRRRAAAAATAAATPTLRPDGSSSGHYYAFHDITLENTDPKRPSSPSSLAQRLHSLQNKNNNHENEFEQRLLLQQEQAACKNTHQGEATPSDEHSSRQQVWFASLGSSAILVLLATERRWFARPSLKSGGIISGLWADLKAATDSAVSLLWLLLVSKAWTLVRSTPAVGNSSKIATLLHAVLYLKLIWQPSVFVQLWKQILPLAFSTLVKLVITDLWSRFWVLWWKQVDPIFNMAPSMTPVVLNSNEHHSESSNSNEDNVGTNSSSRMGQIDRALQETLVPVGHYLTSIAKRGIKRLFQTGLQKYVHGTMGTFYQDFYYAPVGPGDYEDTASDSEIPMLEQEEGSEDTAVEVTILGAPQVEEPYSDGGNDEDDAGCPCCS